VLSLKAPAQRWLHDRGSVAASGPFQDRYFVGQCVLPPYRLQAFASFLEVSGRSCSLGNKQTRQ